MEYPPLVAGETSRFAVHFTNLARFEPVRTGRAEVRLSGADAQAFEAAGPDRPGYFGIDVTPARAGRYNLSVALTRGHWPIATSSARSRCCRQEPRRTAPAPPRRRVDPRS